VRRRLIIPAFVAALAACVAAAAADSGVTLYAGAQLNATMDQSLSSKTAKVGDTFTMSVVPPYPSGNTLFAGSQIQGVVTSVQRAGQGTKPQIGMQLQYLRLSDGTVANISGTVTSAQQKSSAANSVGKTALGALGGMLIGNAIGQTLFHTGGGGAVGFIGGALLGANNKEDVTIPQGSTVTMQLNEDVTIRRQSPYE